LIEISSTRSRTSHARRAALVSAAYDLVAQHGLEGLRTRDIAARAGVNIATLHYYFATKETLLAAVVAHVTQLFRSLHAPLPPSATAFDELRHLLLGQARRRRAESRVDVVMHELMLRSRRDKQVRKAFAALLAGWRAVVEDIVRRCKRERSIRADATPETAAAIITAFIIGANLELGIAPTTFAFGRTARQLLAWLAC
jgi:AcrR family transcriptional regulator